MPRSIVEALQSRARGAAPLVLGLALTVLLSARAGRGAAAHPDATVQPLLSVPVAEADARELDMETVEYPPGGSSPPHRHDAYVLVYVLSGELEMQVSGQPLRRLHAGDTFVERPSDVHEVSRNASDTAPARFLVVMLKKPPQPATPKPGGT